MTRPSWDQQFMDHAQIAARRSTCLPQSQPHDWHWARNPAVLRWCCAHCPAEETGPAGVPPAPGVCPGRPSGGRQVGCVIVVDRRIVSTGYNGSLPGTPHCDEAGHLHDAAGNCVRTVHAEANAVADAAARGVRLDGGTAFVTFQPCLSCFKLLVAAGIRRVVCGERYDPAREEAQLIEALASHALVEIEVFE